MSVSARDRKSVIYSELERFRALRDQQTQQLRAQDEEIARLKAVRRPSNAAPSAQSLTQFCAAYCATHGVRSVPCHVVRAWRNDQ